MSPGKPELVGGSQQEQSSSPEPATPGSEAALRLTSGLRIPEKKSSYIALLVLTAGAFYVAP